MGLSHSQESRSILLCPLCPGCVRIKQTCAAPPSAYSCRLRRFQDSATAFSCRYVVVTQRRHSAIASLRFRTPNKESLSMLSKLSFVPRVQVKWIKKGSHCFLLVSYVSSARHSQMLLKLILGLQVPKPKKFQKFRYEWTRNRHKATGLRKIFQKFPVESALINAETRGLTHRII